MTVIGLKYPTETWSSLLLPRFSQCNYRLSANKCGHGPKHDMSSQVWTRMTDRLQMIHVSATESIMIIQSLMRWRWTQMPSVPVLLVVTKVYVRQNHSVTGTNLDGFGIPGRRTDWFHEVRLIWCGTTHSWASVISHLWSQITRSIICGKEHFSIDLCLYYVLVTRRRHYFLSVVRFRKGG